MLSIPELNFGSIDAVSYRDRSKKNFQQQILYREHYLEQVRANDKYFVIGEKGTGKTSYAVFLENSDYEETRAKVVELNSTDYQKFIGLKETGRLSLSSYSDVWRVILLLLLSDTVSSKAPQNIFSSQKFKSLREAIDSYYQNAFRPEVDTSLEIIQESEAALKILAGYVGASGKEKSRLAQTSTNFQLNLLALEREFENALSSLKLDKDIILFIDGIDIRPADIEFTKYIQCMQGLANAAWQVNTDFLSNIKDSKGRMKVCLLMRPDILDQIGFQNLNAKVRDNSVVLNWQTTYDTFKSSPIFNMVSGILSRQQISKIDNVDAWKHYFPYELQNQRISEKSDDPFIGFLRYSFYRPRDIMQFLILMQEWVVNNQGDKVHFTEKSFHRCEAEFSDYLLGEVRDYLSFYYSSFDFDQIVGFFSLFEGSNSFSWEQFETAHRRYQDLLSLDALTLDELKGTPEDFLQFLYSLNIIGYLEPEEFGGSFVHWCFRDRTPVKLRPRVKFGLNYTVHPGLARSLLVGRTAMSARPPRKSASKQLRPSSAPRLTTGTVVSFDSQKGFGFVSVDGAKENAFFSINEVRKAKITGLQSGQKLKFQVSSREGRLRATSLERID